MKIISAVILLALGVSGCKGPAGPEGPAGTGGQPRPVWVDATGAVVSTSEAPVYFDSKGLIWQVDPETATLRPLEFHGPGTFYLDAECAGPKQALADPRSSFPSPRVVFTFNDDALRVRPDSLQSVEADGGLFVIAEDGGCIRTGPSRVVNLDATKPGSPITPPSTPFAPPLHQETR